MNNMEYDAYNEFMRYYTKPGTPEYTVYKVLTVDEMLQYTLDSLNKSFANNTNTKTAIRGGSFTSANAPNLIVGQY